MKPPPTITSNEWCHAAPSKIHGLGLFARLTIPFATAIVEYAGPRIAIRAGKEMAEAGNVFVFRANRREFIDGSVSHNLARYANHSCQPNAASVRVEGQIWLRAKRTIAKGEEITYDYGFTFRDTPTVCSCHSPGCIGVIVAARHRAAMGRLRH